MVLNFITPRRLVSLIMPGAVLLFAALALEQEEVVRETVVPYANYFCFGALAAAALLSWYHNYSRVLCTALVVGLAVWGLGLEAPAGDLTKLATAFLLPLNFVLFTAFKERGLATLDGLVKITLIGAQVFVLYWFTKTGDAIFDSFFTWDVPVSAWSGLPSSAYLLFGVTALFLTVMVLFRQTNVEAGLLWTLVAVFAGVIQAGEPGTLYLYCGGAGVVLMFSVLEHSFDLAYRDELTGLPGRRAFNEVLRQLRRRYAIAMCDVDHFKEFNDTYGHEAGDRVLKIVAAKLLGVRGRGRAFRYGGEEFALIFKRSSAADVQPFVETLRQAVAGMNLTLNTKHSVNITISIGVADDSSGHPTSEAVLEAADAALYRAKESGRNCVRLAD
jgi:diguanylate cyclase (GGDEF)-like protein